MPSIIYYIEVLLKYRKFILYNILIFAFVSAGISLILPQKFKATAQILPPAEESDLFGALSGISLPKLSRLVKSGSFFAQSTPSDLLAVILQSRTILEKVVLDNDLKRIYKVKKGIEPAIKTLAKATKIKVGEEGVIELTVEAPKPELAANIANSYLFHLDKFLKESNMSRGKNMRVFIEKRLETQKEELRLASESLKAFLERNKLVSLDEETKAIIEAYAQLKSELLKREIQFQITKEVSTEDNPYLLELAREIENFRTELQRIETGTPKSSSGFGAGFAVALKKLPQVAQEYAKRFREFRVQEEIYALLLSQLEQAKILEARDTPTITILDYARIHERRSWPKRKLIVAFACILSFLISTIVSFGKEWMHNIQNNPERYSVLINVIHTIRSDLFSIVCKFKKPRSD
ncbi:MAG: Wzz/FepE/Etk N-terminal domain-containing protein [candidate division WOR-3 bacterium]|nr:Wzz/FepE/Etk N-terminal domain-containing protein [candidate division WOR-3 bacterium]MDW7987194.1 GNVR domain-containing protein [candidate division WOR-3 bacterium]